MIIDFCFTLYKKKVLRKKYLKKKQNKLVKKMNFGKTPTASKALLLTGGNFTLFRG